MLKFLQNAAPSQLAAWSIPLALVLFLCVNLLAALTLKPVRLDLTEDGRYTVSEATRAVLQAVPQPITLRLYQSSALLDEAPQLRVYADRVGTLLRSYEQVSRGMVRVERVDPVPFSPAEDKAIGYNLAGVSLGRSGARGYFGLVGTNSVDQLEIIEALAPGRERYLEYELTRMVLRLSNPTEPRIGVFDGLELFGDFEQRQRPGAIMERLSEDFTLIPISRDADRLPSALDALLIIHPHSLSQAALYAVDQFVLGGGPAVVFVDPLAEHSPPDPTNRVQPRYPASGLDPILSQWGVDYDPGLVVGDITMALDIRAQAGDQLVITPYPPWLIVGQDNLNSDDVVTGRLSLMRISSAGALEPVEGAGTSFVPLISTSPDSMLYESAMLMRRDDPRRLVNMYEPSQTVRTLAARISGPARSAFPERPPADGAEQDHLPEGEIRVVIVADTDMLANDFILDSSGRATTQNAAFLVNALDSLTGGGFLNELRARGLSFRPFSRITRIEAEADARFRATEQRLRTELQELEVRLAELRTTSSVGEGLVAMSAEQQEMIAEVSRRMVELREELRGVQAALRRDIETLDRQLKLINILAMPVVILGLGIFTWLWRRAALRRYLRSRALKAGG